MAYTDAGVWVPDTVYTAGASACEDFFRVPAGTEMSISLLSELVAKHKRLAGMRLKPLQDAYEKNVYPFLMAKAKPKYKPDNRIPVNFAKYLVDTFNGFCTGIPIKVTSDEENVARYLEYLDQYNRMDDLNAEISRGADILGACHELYYNDEDGEIGIAKVDRMESFFVYDDSILRRKLFFVRYYVGADNVEYGSWSDDAFVQHFENRAGYRWTDEAYEHGFGYDPASEFYNNAERRGIFESELPMINAYGKALSEKANDVDYFADAYLKILGPSVTAKDTRSIRDNRIINFKGAADGSLPQVDFLQKPDADATQENLINRLERLIFHISMIADINDEDFGSASGIALRYRLQSMHNLFLVKSRKFTASIQNRYKVIFSNPVAQTHGVGPEDWMSVKVKFTPNLPADVLSEVQAAQQADGMLSRQTRLGMLSFLDDVQSEVERLEEEQEELTARQSKALYGDIDSMVKALEAEGYAVMRDSDGEEGTTEE